MEQVGVNFVPDSQHLSPILLMMYGKSSEFFLVFPIIIRGNLFLTLNVTFQMLTCVVYILVVGVDLEIFLDVHILSSILWK